MENEIYVNIKAELKAKPQKLTNLHQWLFVAVNTAKSIIDNTSKSNLDNVMTFLKGTVPLTFIFAHWWLIFPIKSFQIRIKH